MYIPIPLIIIGFIGVNIFICCFCRFYKKRRGKAYRTTTGLHKHKLIFLFLTKILVIQDSDPQQYLLSYPRQLYGHDHHHQWGNHDHHHYLNQDHKGHHEYSHHHDHHHDDHQHKTTNTTTLTTITTIKTANTTTLTTTKDTNQLNKNHGIHNEKAKLHGDSSSLPKLRDASTTSLNIMEATMVTTTNN